MIQKIEISSKTIIFTVIFIISLRVLWLIRELIFALFLAFIFMSALKPLVYFFERRRVPHVVSVILVFTSTIIGFIFLTAFVLPPLVEESILFFRTFPVLMSEVFPGVNVFLNPDAVNRILPNLTENFLKVVSGIFSNFVFIMSIIFFTFYFLIEEKFLSNFLDKFMDKSQSERIVSLLHKAEMRMGAWVRGELMLMTAIGLMTYVGLSLLGIRYALPLAIIAGAFEIVPIIGPIVSAVPAFFVAASSSSLTAIYVVIFYILVQQLENNIIVPVVMRRAVGLSPLLTLVAITIGGKVGGGMGVLLAVPAALFIETMLINLSKIKK